MLSVPLLLVFSLFLTSSHAFRGLPSLPGYLNAFGSSSGEDGHYYNRGLRVKTYPRVYNGLEQLAEQKEVSLVNFELSIVREFMKVL